MVIIAGETGSGKTTQIPKICLELGRGVDGQIGHTQPRRLAARTVAERIAEELGSPLGETVGYKVRFTDVSADDTLVKLMTDGILLNELARDRQLRRYDTLIIDEAHERSLNIDFILGYLRQLLPQRPDLKVIITSATIDPERFAAAFSGAPIVEVSGRTYPVEVRYRPLHDSGEEADLGQAISDAVDELSAEGPGDILVFLSGEREIRDTADLLAGRGAGTARGAALVLAGCRPPSSTGSSSAAPRPATPAGWCWRPTWPRPRSPCPASSTSSTRAPRASPGTATGPRCSGCRSSRSRRRRPTSARAAAGAPPTASASGCTPKRTSSPGRSSPILRSCAPTWPR